MSAFIEAGLDPRPGPDDRAFVRLPLRACGDLFPSITRGVLFGRRCTVGCDSGGFASLLFDLPPETETATARAGPTLLCVDAGLS